MYLVRTAILKSGIEGDGTFAGEFIPKGTIVYFYSSDDTFVPLDSLLFSSEAEKNRFFKYHVQDEAGNWLVKEDKINHSCDANILSIYVDGIYCDIAVRDIAEGEEITIDYGLFYSSFPQNEECNCGASICRKRITSGISMDIKTLDLWCSRISDAISHIFEVKQNLFNVDDGKARELTAAIKTKFSPRIFRHVKFSLISEDSA